MGVDVCQKDGRFMSCKKMLSSSKEVVNNKAMIARDDYEDRVSLSQNMANTSLLATVVPGTRAVVRTRYMYQVPGTRYDRVSSQSS